MSERGVIKIILVVGFISFSWFQVILLELDFINTISENRSEYATVRKMPSIWAI